MNPCKCGYMGDEERECSKVPICGQNYQSKISGPMLDRFDLHIEVSNSEGYNYGDMLKATREECSSVIKERVQQARQIQQERYEGYGISSNAQIDGNLIVDYAIPVDEGKEMLVEAAQKFKLSMRSYNRILRVARTVADLSGTKWVKKEHIAEALSYRKMDYFRKVVS